MLSNRIIFTILLVSITIIQASAQDFEANVRKTYSLLTTAQESERQLDEKLSEIKVKRIQLVEEIDGFNEIAKPSAFQKKEKANLERQLTALKKQESEAEKKKKEATAFLNEVSELIKASDAKRAKYIVAYEKKHGAIESSQTSTQPNTEGGSLPSTPTEPTSVQPQESPTITETPPSEPVVEQPAAPPVVTDMRKKVKKKEPKPKPAPQPKNEVPAPIVQHTKKYDPKTDVMINPPLPECKLAFDGIEQFTEKKKRETYSQLIFTHTEDFMRAAMKDKEYITCEAAASRVQGGFYYLNMTFTIQTKEAQKAFGFLEKGTPIVFKLINGKTLAFTNNKTDIGVVNTDSGITTYKAQIQLSSSEVKAFMDSELDVVRVAWSAGYEDYEIYDMSVLQNLLKCLERENK